MPGSDQPLPFDVARKLHVGHWPGMWITCGSVLVTRRAPQVDTIGLGLISKAVLAGTSTFPWADLAVVLVVLARHFTWHTVPGGVAAVTSREPRR
jgi:hypothetical protein